MKSTEITTVEAYRAYIEATEGTGSSRSKYGNHQTVVDGVTFDSAAEARDYLSLRDRADHGEISGLRLQPRYLLQEAFVYRGHKIAAIEYVADFEFLEVDTGVIVAWDSKGFATDTFKIKLKLAKFRYPHIDFRVVKAK